MALKKVICQWSDKRCTSQVLGINGEKNSKIINEMITINRSTNTKIAPKYIKNNIGTWKKVDRIEFFVDFETCNGTVHNIKKLPLANTQTIIFMIGVGYINPHDNKWIYHNFTV